MKFNCKELLESFNKELNYNEVREIYKALMAYEIGLVEITDNDEKILEDAFEKYLKSDYTSFDDIIVELIENNFSEKVQ